MQEIKTRMHILLLKALTTELSYALAYLGFKKVIFVR
jgi:hypothetical protein